MLRVLIADDEALARRRLRRLLDAQDAVEIVGEASTGVHVLEFLARDPVDLVLLDIDMPGLSGVDAMRLAGDRAAIVFVTAHAEHAVEAFDGGAVDYLLKPVEAERLGVALNRVRVRCAAPAEATAVDRLPITTRRGVVLVDPSHLTRAVIEGASVVLYTDRGPLYTEVRLSDLERRLEGHGFERVHRRALVNLARIHRLESLDSGGYIAHLDDGGHVPVSRQSARVLRRRWGLR